jgi:hypothetical protein
MTKFFNDQGGLKNLLGRLEAAKAKMLGDVRDAHVHSSKHRAEISSSIICGCFYCEKTFQAREIVDWTDDGQTALCPKCGIDSVIGSASGFPVTQEFLHQMCEHWF